MSKKHQNLLSSILHDPLTSNIHWREIESLLIHLGATIDPAHGARFRITLNQHEFFLHHPHHGSACSKQDIKYLRDCLTAAGVHEDSKD